MTRYEDLQKAYIAHKDEAYTYYIDCRFFMARFAKAFQEYLEVPEFYEELTDSGSSFKKRKYVSLAEADYDDEGDLHFEELKISNKTPEMPTDEDGRWICGLQLVVDRAINSYPKSVYLFQLNFIISENICTMLVAGAKEQEFIFRSDDAASYSVVFEFLIQWLHEAYSYKPGEVQRPEPIGFIVHGKSSD